MYFFTEPRYLSYLFSYYCVKTEYHFKYFSFKELWDGVTFDFFF